jgi:hypothetical protein
MHQHEHINQPIQIDLIDHGAAVSRQTQTDSSFQLYRFSPLIERMQQKGIEME